MGKIPDHPGKTLKELRKRKSQSLLGAVQEQVQTRFKLVFVLSQGTRHGAAVPLELPKELLVPVQILQQAPGFRQPRLAPLRTFDLPAKASNLGSNSSPLSVPAAEAPEQLEQLVRSLRLGQPAREEFLDLKQNAIQFGRRDANGIRQSGFVLQAGRWGRRGKRTGRRWRWRWRRGCRRGRELSRSQALEGACHGRDLPYRRLPIRSC